MTNHQITHQINPRPRIRRAAALATAALFLLGAAGCGSSSGSDASGTTAAAGGTTTSDGGGSGGGDGGGDSGASALPDPCSLLTADDVSSLIGNAPDPAPVDGQSDEAMPFSICVWGELGSPDGVVNVIVSTEGPAGDYAKDRTDAFPSAGSVDVGDGGKLLENGMISGASIRGRTLFFTKGDLSVIIGVGTEATVDDAALTTAATNAAAAIG